MRILKTILIVLAIVIAIPLIVALFIKKEYTIERTITIEKPKEEVFAYIKYLKNQDDFSKWASMDPDMKKTYRGTDGTPGFVAAWESEKDDVGTGEQEIIAIKENERIDYELRFIKPFEATDIAYLTTESLDENRTQVVWGFNGKMTYPFNLMLVIMDFEDMIGDDLSTGLANLKKQLEQ